MDEIEKKLENARQAKYKVCIWGAGHIGTSFGLELLRDENIKVEYYCDSNKELWNAEIVEGIKCISPKELVMLDNVLVFIFVAIPNYYIVEEELRKLGITNYISYEELLIHKKDYIFPFLKRKQIAIYTVITGDYDDIMEPLFISEKCDYFLISDKKPKYKTAYRYVNIDDYVPDYITDNTRKNRYCKINASKIFPNYKYSIYCDGNIQLKEEILNEIDKLPNKTRITTICKDIWESVFREMISVIQNKRDNVEDVVRQAEKYWLEGMPDNYGTVMCGILIREHNNPICKKIMEQWWRELDLYSRRDQLSLPYILWKNGYKISDIKTLEDEFLFDCKYWKLKKEHNVPRF